MDCLSVDFRKIRDCGVKPAQLLGVFRRLRKGGIVNRDGTAFFIILTRPEDVVTFIDDNAAQPLEQPVTTTQKQPPSPSLEKGVLHGVIRILPVLQNPQCDCSEEGDVTADHSVKLRFRYCVDKNHSIAF